MTSYINITELVLGDEEEMWAGSSGAFKAACIWALGVLRPCDHLCLQQFGRRILSCQGGVVDAAPNKYRI